MKNFKLLKTLLVLIGILIGSVSTQMWATTIYYRNSNSWENVYIHYWGGTSGTSWGSLPKMTRLSATSDIWYCDIGNNTNCLFASSSGGANQTSNWEGVTDGYLYDNGNVQSTFVASGFTWYFDTRNVTDWSTPYFRVGHGTYNSAYSMTKVTGTQYLWSCSSNTWGGFAAYTVANSAGYTNAHTIYQPSNEKPTGDYEITKLLNYQNATVKTNLYLLAGSSASTSDGATYYNVTAQTSLPTYTVSYSKSGTGTGTLSVTKYNGSTYDAFSSGGSVNPTQIMKIVATPNSGNALTSFSVSGATRIGETDTYYVTGTTTISATFTPEETHDVTVYYKCGEMTLANSTTESGVGVTTTRSVSAPAIVDHTFSSWTAGSGVKTNSSTSATPISINSKGSGTYSLTANYTLVPCSLCVGSTATFATPGTKYLMSYNADVDAYYYDMASTPENLYFRFAHGATPTYYSATWNGDYPNVHSVLANGSKLSSCNVDVSEWEHPASMYFPGLTGSTIRIWYDYQNAKVWITEATYTVTINNGDHGTVSPNGSQSVGKNSGKSITAYPAKGYMFTEWSKTGNAVLSSTTDNPTTVTATNTGTVTANYAQRYILRGSTKDDHEVAAGMAGWAATDNSSYTSFTMAGSTMTIQATLLASTDYSFNLYDAETEGWHGQGGSSYIPASTEWTLDGTYEVHFTSTIAGVYTFVFNVDGTPKVEITFPNLYLLGDFNSWDEDDTPFDENGKVTVSLSKGEHKFKVLYNGSWYGNGSLSVTTSSVLDQTLSTGGGSETNCTIDVSTAGVYTFGWDANNHKVSVYLPEDKDEVVLTKNKYIYFDARRLTGSNSDYWQRGEFTARFWFKNFASASDIQSVDCTHANALDGWVYYAVVPNNDGIGRIQMNRVPVSSEATCASNVVHAYSRTSSKQNCIAEEVGHEDYCDLWNPSWTTYCPPMSSATLSDNSTSKISWQDGGNDGSTSGKAIWVSTDNTIEVSGAATKAVPDDNMIINYDFKVDGSSSQAGTGNTYSKGSLSNNTTYAITMDAYNSYNSTTGTKLTASQTLYYKALNTYSVTHTLSNVTKSSGRAGDDAAAYHVSYDATYTSNTGYCLPSDITVSIGGVTKTKGTDYTWTVTSGTSGSLSILTDKIEGDVVVTVNGVVKYAMYGSLDDDDTEGAGMSGWSVADNFTYSAGTYTLVLNLTKPNTLYKFRVLDHKDNTSYGLDEKEVIPEKTATKLDSDDDDAQLATAGTGNYTFTVVEDDGYPKITIVNPVSYQITYGIVGDGGSWTSVVDGESNAIATGQYVKKDGSIIFTANPSAGYEVEGWYSNSGCSTPYTSGSDGAAISGAGNTVLTLTVNKARTVYVKIVPVTLTFNGATTSWNTASNWSPACVPTIAHDVIIQKPVIVDVANAKAKSVLIDQSSSKTGKLTVDAGKALVVATTIQKKNAGGSTVATEETDIVLESDGTYGTGALVAGSASTTTKATVHFYSKAKYADSKYINQYFGIPMDSVSKLNYYGSYLRKYDQPTDSWVSFTSESKLGPWTAYRIMREEESEGTYQIGGTLLLPGTSGTQELILQNNPSHAHDNMFANSWTAPIDIRKMVGAFTGAVATIYIFNAGSSNGAAVAKGAAPGNWNSLPVAATMAVPDAFDLNVIPSQQAFLVQADGETGTHKLTLDYKTMVYDPLKAGESSITPTRAPRRAEANDLEIVRLFMTGESGLGDRILMFVRDDFSADELDNGWEAYKLPGSAFAPQLCAYSGLGEMSISATNVIEGTVLGFYAGTEDSEYTFTFDYEGDNVWYLNDLEAQQSTLISAESSYNFYAVPGTVAERRFVISHTPIAHVPTGIDNSEAVDGMHVRKQMINGILYIIRGGQIYSTDGQMVK